MSDGKHRKTGPDYKIPRAAGNLTADQAAIIISSHRRAEAMARDSMRRIQQLEDILAGALRNGD